MLKAFLTTGLVHDELGNTQLNATHSPKEWIRNHPIAAILALVNRCPLKGIPPPKAVCPDLLIGFKSMPYVMRYNHFPH